MVWRAGVFQVITKITFECFVLLHNQGLKVRVWSCRKRVDCSWWAKRSGFFGAHVLFPEIRSGLPCQDDRRPSKHGRHHRSTAIPQMDNETKRSVSFGQEGFQPYHDTQPVVYARHRIAMDGLGLAMARMNLGRLDLVGAFIIPNLHVDG